MGALTVEDIAQAARTWIALHWPNASASEQDAARRAFVAGILWAWKQTRQN